MKSLVIEDNKLVGLMTQEVLEHYGPCDLAFDPIDGFNKYVNSANTNDPYNVIYLDIIMPVYNGYQMLEMIRNYESSRNIKNPVNIIIVSALNDDVNKVKAINMGADAYFNKPFNINEFNSFLKDKGLYNDEENN